MVRLVGKKIGMTHIFNAEGKRCPVTVIEMELPESSESNSADIFKVGDFVDVTGISKGKGFQGGMKRWNWSGSPKSHGSMSHRRVGSIGSSAAPSRVLKGRHMPGHMGNQRVTVQNLRIVKFDKDNNLLAVKGAVPGSKNSKLIIGKAKKKVSTQEEKEIEKESQAKDSKTETAATEKK